MGHSINAVVGPIETLANIAATAGCPTPTELPFGLAIAPLGHEQIDKLTGLEISEIANGFKYLSPALERGLIAAADGGAFAYIETEYFGGIGSQAAAIFSDLLPPIRIADTEADAPAQPDSPINLALRSLEVSASPGQDEFDTVGLHRFRDLEALGLDEWGDD
ncbi:MAG: hypothetical protein Q7V15_12410 [Phenylobacterium sp.]|uniref:hypothetical protein n=1 Tax=Phenylobacterium sp. TaxID=1871053 RepID=UPI0027216BA0|nr:hypothetical protein [Phenylobacterium sp.]MDO8902146.1 hypothetical protein [Phenylobacterium sp.]